MLMVLLPIKKERDAKVIELLETVGLQAEHADRFLMSFPVDSASVLVLHVRLQ